MEKTVFDCQLELLEPMLGTVPKNKDVYAKFIASKCVDAGLAEEEVETVPSIEERGWTGFHVMPDGTPFVYDYFIKGFICESARTLKTWGALKQLQDKFKRYCFVTPRRIMLPAIEPKPLERPLRAMTAQGPRVTLTRSDMIAAGTVLTFQITLLEGAGLKKACLAEVLEYGQFIGLGQWRTGSWGRFAVTKLEEV